MLDRTIAYGLDFLFPALDTAVGRSLRDHGEFARAELDFLLDHSEGEGVLVDVGANIGAIALPFAAARPGWTVVGLEAHRGVAGLLAANALNNRLGNVEVFHLAAGAEAGLADFPSPPLSQARNFGELGFGLAGAETEAVRVAALDTVAPAATRLVKIDVEGFEPQVLAGAGRLLAGRRATWLVEATVQHPQASARVIGAFQAAGYSVHWFYAPFATPASAKGPPDNPFVGDANVVALPPGMENRWGLPVVGAPDERRPGNAGAYPYLARYGFR